MKRRTFLKKGIIHLGAAMISPAVLASCKKEASGEGKSVIVIGAGISGLAAARRLMAEGFAVTVLEAQDRVGGRLRCNRSLGIAFDEGASWIHGHDGNPMTNLAKESGMITYPTDDDNFASYDIGGVKRSTGTYADEEEKFYNMLDSLSEFGNAAESFETVFQKLYPQYANDRLWKFFLSTYVTFDRGDLNKLSSTLYNEGEEFGGVEKISVNGYDTIPQHLASGLDILLNQRVTKIDYSGTKVKVAHNGSESEADYAVVTVPLGVLKNQTIQFTPGLPAAKQTAIEKVGMNCVNKFLLVWDAAFWDDVQYISYTPEAKDKFNYFVNVKKFHPSVNALMTFAYADGARETETMTDAEVTNAVMAHLRDIYGNNIPLPVNMLRTKWGIHEYAFGAYSYTAVGTEMRHFDDLAEEVDDKLFFAGEHTEADYFSTAHGAYLSGEREAQKIVNLQ